MPRFLIFAAAFLALTLLVASGSLDSFDRLLLFDWPSFLSAFLYLFSPPATLFWLSLLLLLLYQRKGTREMLLFAALFFFTLLVEIFLKTVVATQYEALHAFFPFMEGTYPSGHILRATLFAGVLVRLGYSRLFWSLPLLQGLAMLAVAGHTMSDLLGGYLLAMSALSFLDCVVEAKLFANNHAPREGARDKKSKNGRSGKKVR